LKVYRKIWQLSLLSFIIAAVTGFLYRYGMLYPLPDWLNFANIRHAHSHLMFFNWISPPVMAWMAVVLTRKRTKLPENSVKGCLYTMLFLGFLSYPFFLLYGYHSVSIGTVSLPLAAIISGLVMITWYWFGWIYYQHKNSGLSSLSVLFFDAALLALMISSLGAWGVSIFQFTAVDSPLVSSAMTHFFLAVFTEGWAVLAILGMMWNRVEERSGPVHLSFSSGWLWLPVLFGSMLIFPFSLSQTLVTPPMLFSAKLGLLLIVGALSANLYLLLKAGLFTGFIWRSVLVLLGLKILFQFMAVFPFDIWPGEHGLRVLYLHILLLGLISFVLIEVCQPESNIAARVLFATTVFAVLISLVFISGYWPPEWMVPQPYFWVMIIAFLPVLPSCWLLYDTIRGK
jgi:hypothetical protein